MRELGKNQFEDRKMLIQEGTVAGVYFLEESLKRTFIEKLKDELAVLNGVSEKEHHIEYKNIDLIPEDKINSSLSCQEYVYMYCMIRRGFNNMLEERFEQILRQLNLGFLKEKKSRRIRGRISGTRKMYRSLFSGDPAACIPK